MGRSDKRRRRASSWSCAAGLVVLAGALGLSACSESKPSPLDKRVGERVPFPRCQGAVEAGVPTPLRVAEEPHPPTPPSPPGLQIGGAATLNYVEGKDLCAEAALVAASGARLLREDLVWSIVEPKRGDLNWTRYDAIFAAAAQVGLTVLPIVNGTPSWAGPEDAVPSDPEPYTRFVARVVKRYGPAGSFWRAHPRLPNRPPPYFELYNEPFLRIGDTDPDPKRYARLVRATVRRARKANAKARFMIAGETTWTADNESYSDWMNTLYEEVPDLGRFFEAVSVHPYSERRPDIYTPGGDTRWQSRRLEEVRRVLVRNGDRDKPLWITEIGWPTCPTGCVTEKTQAEYLKTFHRLVATRWRKFVEAVFVFKIRDYEPQSTDDPQQWYGILRPDKSPKPAWEVVRGFAAGR